MNLIADRTVFITGCSSGIGLAATLQFAKRGYRVVATARTPESLRELEDAARDQGWALRATTCDVTSEDSMSAAIDFTHRTFGPIHILVNNAGYGLMGPVELVSLEEARRQFEVNTLGAIRLVQLVVPDMRAAEWGRIINVGSIAGRIAIPLGGWYSASKFALEALSSALRLELEPFIQTVCIEPGPVKSQFMQNTRLVPPLTHISSRYHAFYRMFERRRSEKRPFEISADAVARVIIHATEVRRPKARYVLTVPARAGVLAKRFLSDRMMERAIRVFYGLKGIERQPGNAR